MAGEEGLGRGGEFTEKKKTSLGKGVKKSDADLLRPAGTVLLPSRRVGLVHYFRGREVKGEEKGLKKLFWVKILVV